MVKIEIAMQYHDGYQENIYSFVNCIKTKEGGTHEVGFKSALTKSINSYARKNNLAKEDESFSGEDVREGLTAVINLRIPNPQFEGQTKTKLGNGEIKGLVDSFVFDNLNAYLDKNPAVAKAIIERTLMAYRVRAAARKAQELERKKSALDTAILPGKLADCSETNAAKCEIFLVEGDSAGGSAKQGRDRRFQAILPLRGKILNVEKARIDKILTSQEIRTMITAIGPGVISGLGGNGGSEELNDEEYFKKLNYHKIVPKRRRNNYIEHYTHTDLSVMIAKTNEWSEVEANLLFQSGHPAMVGWRFMRVMGTKFYDSFIRQGGWKAGTVGLVESIYQAFSYFIVYAKLWEKQRSDKT